MQTARVVIVGGGLSGLYAAYLLQQRGFRDHVLLEAREVLGGRIVSVPASVPGSVLDATAEAANRFDLGPSSFRPGYQRQLDHLVDELGLARFEQFENGDMMVERSPGMLPQRRHGLDRKQRICRAILADAYSRKNHPPLLLLENPAGADKKRRDGSKPPRPRCQADAPGWAHQRVSILPQLVISTSSTRRLRALPSSLRLLATGL